MLRAAIGLLRASGRVLLEIAPAHLDVGRGRRARWPRHPRVTEVHDLHVWEISQRLPALSAHVLVEPDARLPRHPPRARGAARRAVRARPHDAPGRPRRGRRGCSRSAAARRPLVRPRATEHDLGAAPALSARLGLRAWRGRSCWVARARARSRLLAHYVFHISDTAMFILAALALIPLAWLIGEATEHVAEHTGPGSAASSTRASATRPS